VQVIGKALKALPTRNAILPAIMLLSAANKILISTLVEALPKRYTHSDRIQNFTTEKSRAIIEQDKKDPATLIKQLGFANTKIKNIDETDVIKNYVSR
jgi:phosphomannomutase